MRNIFSCMTICNIFLQLRNKVAVTTIENNSVRMENNFLLSKRIIKILPTFGPLGQLHCETGQYVELNISLYPPCKSLIINVLNMPSLVTFVIHLFLFNTYESVTSFSVVHYSHTTRRVVQISRGLSFPARATAGC
jgi:hypothetical protein